VEIEVRKDVGENVEEEVEEEVEKCHLFAAQHCSA
jgi:hypothetical protein